MSNITRIIVLGLGAGLGVSVLGDAVARFTESAGFDPASPAAAKLSAAVAAGLGVAAADVILRSV